MFGDQVSGQGAVHIGGGEIVQEVVFDLKSCGASNKADARQLIHSYGLCINRPEDIAKTVSKTFKSGGFQSVTKENYPEFERIALEGYHKIRQFIYMNIPAVQTCSSGISLDYIGSSLSVEFGAAR